MEVGIFKSVSWSFPGHFPPYQVQASNYAQLKIRWSNLCRHFMLKVQQQETYIEMFGCFMCRRSPELSHTAFPPIYVHSRLVVPDLTPTSMIIKHTFEYTSKRCTRARSNMKSQMRRGSVRTQIYKQIVSDDQIITDTAILQRHYATKSLITFPT